MSIALLASPSRRLAATLCALGLVAVAVGRVHLRVHTTMLGYEIGKLKSEEGELLQQRSALKMQLAKLTTKKHLQLMTEGTEDVDTPRDGTLALK